METTFEDFFNLATKHLDKIEDNEYYECVEDFYVDTPSGVRAKVDGVIRKTGEGVRIETASGKSIVVAKNHLVMTPEGWEAVQYADMLELADGTYDEIVKHELTDDVVFYDISIPAPHAYITPNGMIHHNTFVVTQTLKNEGLHPGNGYNVVKGKITTAALYQTLYLHREGGVLMFDDTDSVWGDQEAANILKAALDSYDTRMLSWYSARTVNISKLSRDDKEEFYKNLDKQIEDDPSNSRIKFPSEFEYKGQILFISNLPYEKFDEAVLNRSAKIDMTLTQDQLFQRMEGILEHLGEKGVDMSVKREILGFIKGSVKSGQLKMASMRTYVAAENVYLSGVDNWREMLDYV